MKRKNDSKTEKNTYTLTHTKNQNKNEHENKNMNMKHEMEKWKIKNEKQLDDGWPESVEEQGLLLLVWRCNFRNGIWKLCYRQSRRGVSRQNS